MSARFVQRKRRGCAIRSGAAKHWRTLLCRHHRMDTNATAYLVVLAVYCDYGFRPWPACFGKGKRETGMEGVCCPRAHGVATRQRRFVTSAQWTKFQQCRSAAVATACWGCAGTATRNAVCVAWAASSCVQPAASVLPHLSAGAKGATLFATATENARSRIGASTTSSVVTCNIALCSHRCCFIPHSLLEQDPESLCLRAQQGTRVAVHGKGLSPSQSGSTTYGKGLFPSQSGSTTYGKELFPSSCALR